MDQALEWQSPNFPKIFEQYDRADFAQEFLRRSPAYRGARSPPSTCPIATGTSCCSWAVGGTAC